MIRKFVIRLFFGCLALVGLVLTAATVVGWLAFQQPAFYAERRAQTFAPADEAKAERLLEQAEQDAQRWLHASLARQQAQQSKTDPPPVPQFAAWGAPYDPAQDVHTFRITEEQLNALLASDRHGLSKPLKNARIRIEQDRIELGVELQATAVDAVVSVVLEPTMTNVGGLRLGIQAARIGKLPIPFNAILGWWPRDIVYTDRQFDLDLTPPAPHLTLKLPQTAKGSPTIKSIHCTAGEIAVELLPPVLDPPPAVPAQQPQVTRRNAPAAH
jgi:hypothetical protein